MARKPIESTFSLSLVAHRPELIASVFHVLTVCHLSGAAFEYVVGVRWSSFLPSDIHISATDRKTLFKKKSSRMRYLRIQKAQWRFREWCLRLKEEECYAMRCRYRDVEVIETFPSIAFPIQQRKLLNLMSSSLGSCRKKIYTYIYITNGYS